MNSGVNSARRSWRRWAGPAAIAGLVLVSAAGRVASGEADPATKPGSAATIVVHEPKALSDAVRAYRRSLTEGRPGLRGFRAPILDASATPWPLDPPGAEAPVELREAASTVSRRLAPDGLLATSAAAIEALGVQQFARPDEGAMHLLQRAGLPIDLLACFGEGDGAAGGEAAQRAVVARLASLQARGLRGDELARELAAMPFHFVKSRANFRVALESGEEEIASVRLQLTRGTDWAGVGDGGCLDVARQLVAALPDAQFIASIERKHLSDLLRAAREWPLTRLGQFVVIPEDLPVAQWAQDNGKAGFVEEPGAGPGGSGAGGANRRPALLVPRYASRSEDASTFVPGETFLIDALAEMGRVVIQSPLLFQGGDLLPVRDPGTGGRIMLIGEAEIYRNVALGLTTDQVLEAFRIEFGVDRCVALPAVSLHIDYEVCVRSMPGERARVIAFVNDTPAALPIIISCGLKAMIAGGVINAEVAANAEAALREGTAEAVTRGLNDVLTALWGRADATGAFPLSLAQLFSTGPADSGVANLHRFLLATDIIVSRHYDPTGVVADGHAQAYLRSFGRRDDDRASLHRQLRAAGFEVVGVPSLADADRSLNYLNGIHERGRYLMPAYGGLYGPVDAAAAASFRRVLGGEVRLDPILTGESQRRVGALHCSVDVAARP